VKANHAEFNHEWFSSLGGMSATKGKGRRLSIQVQGAGEGRHLTSRAEVADRHGAEFAIGVTIRFKRRVVGSANPQRVGLKQEHRNGIAAKEKVSKIGSRGCHINHLKDETVDFWRSVS